VPEVSLVDISLEGFLKFVTDVHMLYSNSFLKNRNTFLYILGLLQNDILSLRPIEYNTRKTDVKIAFLCLYLYLHPQGVKFIGMNWL